MPTINKKQLPKLISLYRSGKSAREISIILRVSIDAVYYAMRKNNISRRSSRENNLLKFEQKPLSFTILPRLSLLDEKLKLSGCMLYWSEGYKTIKSAGIDFANSDAEMILLFLSFLRRICRVDEKRLRIYLYCYTNQDVPKLIKYWSSILHIPEDQFTKPYVRKDFRVDKKGKMPYGLVHIRYMDKKLLTVVLGWIEEYKRIFCVGTQAVNGGSL